MHSPCVCTVTLLLTIAGSPAAGQRPLNLDFERSSVSYANRPWGWSLGFNVFARPGAASFELDSAWHHAGRQSLRVTGHGGDTATLLLQLKGAAAWGRTIRLQGWVCADTGARQALVTLEAWKGGAPPIGDTASIAGGGAANDWRSFDLSIRVPEDHDIHSVVVSLSLIGGGSVWFDDFQMAMDGKPLESWPESASAPAPADLRWLALHSTTLRTATVGGSPTDDDLGAFARIVGSARIIALGESTHGTHEFFTLKARVLDYAVRRLGVRVFAIEANQVAAEQVNRYVQGGPGTARDAMRVMFRVWNTEEMEALVDSLRQWNATHPTDRVRFAGYDMQDHRRPVDSLRAILGRVRPSWQPRVDELLGEYRSRPSYATPDVADTTRARWAEQATTLWRDVTSQRSAWLAAARPADDSLAVEWAVQDANLIRQAARFNVALSSPERDSLMAANLDWVLQTLAPRGRVLVWAHDVHVSKGGDTTLSFNGGAQMGAYLRRTHGDDYRNFSLLTYQGTYSATRSFTDYAMIAAEGIAAPVGSVEAALHALPRPAGSVGWIVDLRRGMTDAGAAWLRQLRPIRHVGFAAYDYGFDLNAQVPREFDGVLFVDRSSASRMLP